jgi:hypothetical protein
MTTEQLQDFFETEGFQVHLFEQDGEMCAEIEMWTNGGVDMIITTMPFTLEEFIKWVDEFDIDEQIDLHRQGELYKQNFTIWQSLEDFIDYHVYLKRVVKKIKEYKKVKQ